MLRELANVHSAFARWNEQGYKPAEWNQPFCSMPPQVNELAAQFARHPKQPIVGRERGYSLSAWNGREDEVYGAFFSVFAGDSNQWGSNPFPNSVSIDLPRRSAENADLINGSGMRAILLAIVAGWEPDAAEIKPWKFYDLPPGEHLPTFRTGWMSYVGPRYAPLVTPMPAAIAESVPGGDLLMLATREPFDVSNAAHMAGAAAIQHALELIQSMVPQPNATWRLGGSAPEKVRFQLLSLGYSGGKRFELAVNRVMGSSKRYSLLLDDLRPVAP